MKSVLIVAATNIVILIVLCALVASTYVYFFEPRANFLGPRILEHFSNALTPGEYPESDQFPLLKGVFPLTKSTVISNNGVQDVWKKQGPDLTLSSYKQTTNNEWDGVSPDNGSCTPVQFCGSFYAPTVDKKGAAIALKPVPYGAGARVNLFRNEGPNLMQFNYKENVMY
jgi:hypothetical protein